MVQEIAVMPQLTIVITTRNNFHLTRNCLESIVWTLAPGSYDIVIVDDGSSDQTLQLAEHFQFLRTQRGGLYEAWNIGVRAAQTDYVALLNNDLFFCMRDWWSRILTVFESTHAGWLFPLTIETQSIIHDLYAIVSRAESVPSPSFEPRYGDIEACSFFIRKSLFDLVGPFDDRFKVWYGEKDYEIRMIQEHVTYGRVNNVIVRHFASSTLGLAPQGDFKPQISSPDRELFTNLARADRALFCSKYSEADLAPLGLRMPPFAPGPLKAL